ncbi:methyl-accepting chemotaxis protein [Mixta intestinalis]|uniref:Methyl-accepting chemotaxis protein III n=1 Tax=Mixta intestinalis TaxID=1615494 RepID=A0A6P1PY26_9GAMM|nr:methyl-accepting chemotaxis protein [Mixta intestinalis]QHM71061.1 Methyl-accepting chemotaxis protein III [Mixta intestinalis]
MQLLKNFTIRAVMLSILGLFCLLWSAVGMYSVHSLNALSEGNSVDRQLVAQMTTLSKGNDQYFRFVTRLSRVMETRAAGGTPDAAAFDNVQKALDGMTQQLAQFTSAAPGPMDAATSTAVEESWARLLEQGVKPQMQLAQQGSLEDYRRHANSVTPALSREFGALTEKYNAVASVMLDQTRVSVDRITIITRITIIVAVICGLLILLFTDRYLVTMLVRPLDRIRDRFRSIADGDLSQPIDDFGRNCIGKLVPLLRAMQDSLRDAVSAIRGGTENIYRGAAEISMGNNDLSSRTEQQAAALEQTAASMEQLTATVKLNAENARQASELADNASLTASEGGRLVNDVVTTMSGISESSKKIAEITSVINSIAFQTNILALNAAVEAARAGEQGRGFAVVASEVRNLASRSAGAAKEIESLIGDSVQRVNSGSRLVNEAGSTMNAILQAVSNVTEIMKQIASASEEQSKGIAQVGIAVAEMDTVTQQNASLVEEVSAAASALERQTEDLQRSVAKFRLSAPGNSQAVKASLSITAPVRQHAMPASAGVKEEWVSF